MQNSSKAILAMEIFIGAIVALSIAFFAFGGFYVTVLRPDYAPVAESRVAMQEVQDRVALQDEQQYAIVAKNGSPAEICRAATEVAEDYHRADRGDSYTAWKAIVHQRCDQGLQ